MTDAEKKPSGNRPFQTSLAAQAAARVVIETARECGLLDDGGMVVDPALAEMEKALFAGILRSEPSRPLPVSIMLSSFLFEI